MYWLNWRVGRRAEPEALTVAVVRVNREVHGLRMVVHVLGDDQAPGSARTPHLLVPRQLEPEGGRPHRAHTLIEFHQEQFEGQGEDPGSPSDLWCVWRSSVERDWRASDGAVLRDSSRHS